MRTGPERHDDDSGSTLRERKKRRTRQAIIDAGVDLIERVGYDRATVADIAAAADIGTRTFFSYFDSKDALLFPESDRRVRSVLTALEERGPGDGPVDVLLAALEQPGDAHDEMLSRAAQLRLRLMDSSAAVRGRALALQHEAEHTIAAALRAAFPDELDEITTAALVGAYVGAVTASLRALMSDGVPDPGEIGGLRARLQSAVEAVLRPPSGTDG